MVDDFDSGLQPAWCATYRPTRRATELATCIDKKCIETIDKKCIETSRNRRMNVFARRHRANEVGIAVACIRMFCTRRAQQYRTLQT